MRERLMTLACAVGALLLFIVMFVQRQGAMGGRNDMPRPTTAERRGNGYHAALAWLEAEGIRAVSLRDRFDSLAGREDLTPSGNLLIVTLPAANGFNTWEFIPLDRWIRAGNTLLVLAALADNPDWAFSQGGFASGDLNLLTGLDFESVRLRDQRLQQRGPAKPSGNEPRRSAEQLAETFRAFTQPQRTVLLPNRGHAYFNDVKTLVALSDYPQQLWTVKVPYEGFVLALAHDQAHGEGALWTRPLGQGRIVVSGFGSLLTNRAIGLADNARLLANLVGVNVAEHGTVLYDDLHQGLGAAYDPDKFYQDKRLYITLGVLLALWLVWVLGSTKLRAPVANVPAPREAELIRAAGNLFARALPVHAGARRLLENFFRRVSDRAGEPRRISVPWEVLERHGRVSSTDISQLQKWYADACASRRVPLQRLQSLLARIERQMAT